MATPVRAQGRITGTVKDETGQPIRGATITARNLQSVPSELVATSDDKGRWFFIGVQPGQWVFSASADGYVAVAYEARIAYLRPNQPIGFTLQKAIPGMLSSDAAKALQGDLKAADTLLADRKWDEAIVAYKNILLKVPQLSMLNVRIGQAYRAKQDTDHAIAAYLDAVKADPSLVRVYVELGDLYISKGLPDEAARQFRAAAERDPSWARPVSRLGHLALTAGNTVDAVVAFEKVVALEPGSADANDAAVQLAKLKK